MGKHYGEIIIAYVLEMKQKGYTHKLIGEKYGFTTKQIKNLVKRYNQKQHMEQAGIEIKKRGRPRKDIIVTDEDKMTALKYELNRKEYEFKRLKMQNELLRDFLKETERG